MAGNFFFYTSPKKKFFFFEIFFWPRCTLCIWTVYSSVLRIHNVNIKHSHYFQDSQCECFVCFQDSQCESETFILWILKNSFFVGFTLWIWTVYSFFQDSQCESVTFTLFSGFTMWMLRMFSGFTMWIWIIHTVNPKKQFFFQIHTVNLNCRSVLRIHNVNASYFFSIHNVNLKNSYCES